MRQLNAYVLANESKSMKRHQQFRVVYCQSIPTVLNMKQHEIHIGNRVAGQLNFVFIF